jgi:hypothetical protein
MCITSIISSLGITLVLDVLIVICLLFSFEIDSFLITKVSNLETPSHSFAQTLLF